MKSGAEGRAFRSPDPDRLRGVFQRLSQAIQDAELEERSAEHYQQVALVRERDFERYLRERKERVSSFSARASLMTIHPSAAARMQVKSARLRAGCT
jgi:hypothetical protein